MISRGVREICSRLVQQPRVLRGYINLYTTQAASYQMADDETLMKLFESRTKYESAKHHIGTVSLVHNRVMPTLQGPGNPLFAKKFRLHIQRKHAKKLEKDTPLYNAYELLASLEAVAQFDIQWRHTKASMKRFTELIILDRRDTKLGFVNVNGKVKVIRKYLETHTFTRILEYIMTRPIRQLMASQKGVGEEMAQECWEYMRQEEANFSFEDYTRSLNSLLEFEPNDDIYVDFLQNRVLGQSFGNCSTFVHVLSLVANLEQKFILEEKYEHLKMFQGIYDYLDSQLPYLLDWTAIDNLSFIPTAAFCLSRSERKVSQRIWDLLIQGFCKYSDAYPHADVCRFLESILLKGASKKEMNMVLQSYQNYCKIHKKLNFEEKTHYMFIFANLQRQKRMAMSAEIIEDYRKSLRENEKGSMTLIIPNKLGSILRAFPSWKPDFKPMEDHFSDVYNSIRRQNELVREAKGEPKMKEEEKIAILKDLKERMEQEKLKEKEKEEKKARSLQKNKRY